MYLARLFELVGSNELSESAVTVDPISLISMKVKARFWWLSQVRI